MSPATANPIEPSARRAGIFALAAILLLDLVPGWVYGIVVPVAAMLLLSRPPGWPRFEHRDLVAIATIFAAVVISFRVAFVGFGTERVAGLFIAFAVGLVIGVAGPVVYTVAVRRRPIAELGLRVRPAGPVLAWAGAFALAQVAITLWGYDLPAPVDWVPLLAMSVVVGFFEAVFFRGFVQERLEASAGPAVGVIGAAAVYSAYHLGFGMPAGEMLFLFGLGVTYAMAFRTARSILVLWPLLTPLGAFYNNLEAGDLAGELPWASIAGFADVAVVMGLFLLWGRRRSRRMASAAEGRPRRGSQPRERSTA